ncbi:hypothetical protein PCIT_b0457 [Pseudoalteromonas citrea]|uniref:Uncharacterized protein n=1 Tax=Pseudoalteromonas citrea TaxID=43655 RepID=A0AAD4AEN1_9GAMM|nr:hypothetical protein PCIT_b0457 [Pseudoalteromonas citrea]
MAYSTVLIHLKTASLSISLLFITQELAINDLKTTSYQIPCQKIKVSV